MADKSLLNYQSDESIGLVNAVDTGTAMALITDDKSLSQLQINQLLAVHSPRPGRHIIAMIIKIFRKSVLDDTVEVGEDEENDGLQTVSINQIKMVFIGEFIDCEGTRRNIFKRNVSAVPSIDADCYKIEGDRLTNLMQSISGIYAETRKNELDSVVENCYTILFSIRGLYCRGGVRRSCSISKC